MKLSAISRFSLLLFAGLLPISCGSGPASTNAPADPGGDTGTGGGEDVVDDTGGGGDAGGGGAPGVSAAPGAEETGRLLGAVPDQDTVHVLVKAPEAGVEAAIFTGPSAASVYTGPPALEGVGAGITSLTGLTPGETIFLGLGVRRSGSSYVQSGAVLEVRLAAPVFVDPNSTAPSPDGASPSTAFADPLTAILSAFGTGANVWLRAGTYDISSLPVFPGTALYGGFDAAFDPTRRGETRTVFRAVGTLPVVSVAADPEGAVIDGITIEGQNLASVGVDVDKSAFQMRGIEIRGCSGRGIRLRNEGATAPLSVTLVGCTSSSNGGDGLSANGPFDLVVDASVFSNNVQEGLDVDDLVAPNGETASLSVSGSRFSGNGTQGLDVDLSEPLVLGGAGGRFEVEIEGSLFTGNGEEGLLVDFDFELIDGWEAEVVLRGNTARANGGAGVRVDADAPGSVTVHRLLASANFGDGLSITSETDPGLVVVSSSAFTGNQGAGVRASLGNRVVALTHSILAGNAGGGIVSEFVESTVSSSILWLQPNAFTGTRSVASVVESDASRPVFLSAPEFYGVATNISNGSATLAGGALPAVDAVVEVRDDGVARATSSSTADAVLLDPAPSTTAQPTSIAAFAPGSSVDDDWTLIPGSPGLGAGLTGTQGPVDAGVYGAASGGTPGFADAVRTRLFALSATQPAPSTGIAASGTLELRFRGGTLDPGSVDATTVRAFDASGAELTIGLTTAQGSIFVAPPAGGWGAGAVRVQIADVRTTGGTPLCASAVVLMPIV